MHRNLIPEYEPESKLSKSASLKKRIRHYRSSPRVVTYHTASGRRILHTPIRTFKRRLCLSDDLRSPFVSPTFSFKSRRYIFWSFGEVLQKCARTVPPSPLNLFCISHCINCISFVTEDTQTSHNQHYVIYIQMVLDHLIIYIQHALSFNLPLSWPNCDFHIRRRPTYGNKCDSERPWNSPKLCYEKRRAYGIMWLPWFPSSDWEIQHLTRESKKKVNFFRVHDMKTKERVGLQLPSFLTSALHAVSGQLHTR